MDILEFNINYQLILSVIGTILAVLLVFLILQFFWLRAKVNRLYRKYKYFMMGEDGGSIEMKLSTEVRELRDMVESSQGMLHQQELLATMQLKSFQKIGLVPQDFAFYPQLSVWDNLLFFASLYKVRDKGRLNALLEQTDLTAHKNKAAKHLSGGLKRRLNFAIGLINTPQLVFLDEITVGIDPQSRRFILDSVADLTRQEVTVVYTSHYLPEIEQLCSKIALLQHGHLVYQGSLNELLNAQAQTVRFITEPMLQPETLAMLQAAPLDNRGMMQTQQDAAAVYAALQQSGTQIRYFQQGHGSLEAFYLDFLRRETEQP